MVKRISHPASNRPLHISTGPGSSPGRATETQNETTEGPPDGRREPVGSRLNVNNVLRVRLPLLPLWPDSVLVTGGRL